MHFYLVICESQFQIAHITPMHTFMLPICPCSFHFQSTAKPHKLPDVFSSLLTSFIRPIIHFRFSIFSAFCDGPKLLFPLFITIWSQLLSVTHSRPCVYYLIC